MGTRAPETKATTADSAAEAKIVKGCVARLPSPVVIPRKLGLFDTSAH